MEVSLDLLSSLDSSEEATKTIDTLLPGIDPRVWDPKAIALVVIAARAADLRVEGEKGLKLQCIDCRSDANRTFTILLDRLGRFGYRRAIALIEPRTLFPGINVPVGSSRGSEPWTRMHFGYERRLLDDEWVAKHGHIPKSRQEKADRLEFIFSRWNEIDALAPRVDESRILEFVDLLEGEEKR